MQSAAPNDSRALASRGRDWPITPAGFVTALLLLELAICGIALSWLAPANPAQVDAALRHQFLAVSRDALLPEPAERFIYFGLLVLTPVLLGSAILLQRILQRGSTSMLGDVALWAGLFGLALWLRPWTISPFSELVEAASAASRWWIAIAALLVAACVIPWGDNARWRRATRATCMMACCLGCAGLAFSWLVFGPASESNLATHWDAVFYSIVQIAHGGVCLSDVNPQYGCHGEFLRPIFALIGMSVLKATLAMAVLQAVSSIAVVCFVFRIIASPVIASAACVWLLLFTHRVMYMFPDQYFQYMPIRFVFPALSLLMLSRWQAAPGPWFAFAMGTIGGVSVFWNMDSGLVVLLALGLFVTVSGHAQPQTVSRRLHHVACFGGGALVAVLCVLAYLSVRAGHIIDPSSLFYYQRIFFFAGFFMLPMPPAPDYWTIAIAVLAATLALAAAVRARGRVDPALEQAAFLAVMGAGLFGYFVGRSHPQVFMNAAWPSVILVFFLLGRGERTVVRAGTRVGAMAYASIAPIALGLALMIVAGRSGILADIAQQQWRSTLNANGGSAIEQDAAFVARLTGSGEAIGLLADNQASLLAGAGRRSAIPGPGLGETVLRRDADNAIRFLVDRGPAHLFVGTALLSTNLQSSVFEPWVKTNYPALLTAYRLDQVGPGGRLQHLVRKSSPP